MLKSEYSMIMELQKRVSRLERHENPVVKFKRLSPNATIPSYQTAGAAGADLHAANEETMTVFPGATVLVPTGLAMELPPGYEAQVRPRSGLSVKGIAVANSPGTIDEDFRGEVKVILRNHGQTLTIHKGDRVAQLVIARVVQAELADASELSETERGEGGFGSTGVK